MAQKPVVVENVIVLPKSAAKVAAGFLVLTTLPITPATDVRRQPQAKFFQEPDSFAQAQRSSFPVITNSLKPYNQATDVRRAPQAKALQEPDVFPQAQKGNLITTITAVSAPVPITLQRKTFTVETISVVKSQRGTPLVIGNGPTPVIVQSSDLLSGNDTYGWASPDQFDFFAPPWKVTELVVNTFPAYNPGADAKRTSQAKAFQEPDQFAQTQRIAPNIINLFGYNPATDVTRLIKQAKWFEEPASFVKTQGTLGALNFKAYIPGTDVQRAKQAKVFQEPDIFTRTAPFSAIIINGTAIPPPLPPTLLTAVGAPISAILGWQPSINALTYNVYQGLTPGGETLLTTGLLTTAYTSTGLTAGITYYFKVTAVSLAGESGFSNEAFAVPLPGFERVMATRVGYYGYQTRNIGDVFDIRVSDFADTAVDYIPGKIGSPLFGWMVVVAPTTPLTSLAPTPLNTGNKPRTIF